MGIFVGLHYTDDHQDGEYEKSIGELGGSNDVIDDVMDDVHRWKQ